MESRSKKITDELVSPGHPDKIADLISDTLLTKALEKDKNCKVAIETFITGTKSGGLVVVGGEISSDVIEDKDVRAIVHKVLYETVSKNYEDFNKENVEIRNTITKQSSEINKAVVRDKTMGAGDQGIMIGYACNDNENYMPQNFNNCIELQKFVWDRQKNDNLGLGKDSKVQITNFGGYKVVVSTQHEEDWEEDKFESMLQVKLELDILQTNMYSLYLNPSGSFTKGGPASDTGLTGRKIVVDAYGPSVPVGGGAFSGKDPSKVDRSGAYAARHLAKNIVAHDLADKVLVRLGYGIGLAKPLELTFDTFKTNKVNKPVIESFIKNFDMRPQGIIDRLQLLEVDYSEDTKFSHFGNPNRNWEQVEDV